MKKLKLSTVIYVLFFTFGCGASTQLLDLNIHCDDDCNSNHAVVIRIYQLKNADKFRYASFQSLLQNPEDVLSNDLIPSSKYERTVIPGEKVDINEMEIQEEAAYLGIVADFYSHAKDNWHQVAPLNSDIEQIEIIIHSNSLSYKIVD